jgi:hypothetical protein
MLKLPVKVSKFIKVPLRSGITASTYWIDMDLYQFISGRQIAYVAINSLGTLFFYNKSDTIVKYYLPNKSNRSKVSVTSIPQKNDFIVHFMGTDNKPVTANVLYQDTKYSILKSTSQEEKYYIVNSEGHIEHVIYGQIECKYAPIEYLFEKKYFFGVYFEENFIVIFHQSGIILYNIPKELWKEVKLDILNLEHCDFIQEYYYIKKCKKLVFLLLRKNRHINEFIIIDLKCIDSHLSKYSGNDNIQDCLTRTSEAFITYKVIQPYIENRYGDFSKSSNISLYGYSLDVNEAVLYLTYELSKYTIQHIVMECSLCDDIYKWKEFRIDLPIQWPSWPRSINSSTPIYVSRRYLAKKSLPKYLPMYSLRSLFDIITNEITQYGLFTKEKITGVEIVDGKRIPLISLYIIDKSFNRTIMLLRNRHLFNYLRDGHNKGKIRSLCRYQGIVEIYHLSIGERKDSICMLGIMLINDLVVVNDYKKAAI